MHLCKLRLAPCITCQPSVLICKIAIMSRLAINLTAFVVNFLAFGEYFLASIMITSDFV